MNTDDYKARGQQIVQRLNAAIDGIRQDPRLSAEAKLSDIAAAWLDYRKEVAALQAQDQQEREGEIRRLEQRLFHPQGTTPNATERAARQASYRDALDRALKLDGDAAATTALELAFRTGDDDQARALATVALDRGWHATFRTYAERTPGHADDLRRLEQLKAIETRSDVGLLLEREWSLHASKPEELVGYGDSQLQALADGDLTGTPR